MLTTIKLLLCLLPALFLSSVVEAAPSSGTSTLIEVIVRTGCPHCEAEKAFLDELQKDNHDIEIRYYDIATPQGSDLFKAIVKKAKLSWSLPVTIVGTEILQGFANDETTGRQIKALADRNRDQPEQGFASLLKEASPPPENKSVDEFVISLPGIGELDLAAWPLPTIAVVLGFLDGFNPCAMWVLVTFLIVLAQIGSRRRMWTVAGLFIFAETVMYFMILNLWFRLWDFVGMDRIVTPAVGIIAMGGGMFFIYEGWKSFGSEMACRITNMEQRSRIVGRIRHISSGNFGVLAALAVIALAFSVNVIEFACSIGYPQAFTKIAEVNGLGFWTNEALIGLYTLFYMADDFAVFGLALWGFDKLQLSRQYSRWTSLCGGLLMLCLGMLMLFRPEALKVV